METVGWSGSNFSKLIFYNEKLKTLPQNTFVVLIDASDVLCIDTDINKMYLKFKNMNKNIVFGAENGGHFVFEDYQQDKLLQYMNLFNKDHPTFVTKYGRKWLSENTILNSGLICGYSDKISELFDIVIRENINHASDQISIINTILNNPNLVSNITVDYESSLFHNFSVFHEDYLLKSKYLCFKNKEITPFFIHFPGMTFANQSKLFTTVRSLFCEDLSKVTM